MVMPRKGRLWELRLQDVQVDVDVAVRTRVRGREHAPCSDVGERGLRRLLHDIAELASDGELALPSRTVLQW